MVRMAGITIEPTETELRSLNRILPFLATSWEYTRIRVHASVISNEPTYLALIPQNIRYPCMSAIFIDNYVY